jgi:YidC/Oxa1 family membrane protein insertase
MQKLSPELKKIKASTKGDKQKESQLIMELYKEKGVSPFGSIGMLLIQLPILIGLYSGIRKVVVDPHAIVTFAYPALQHLPWMKQLAANPHLFDATLFGVVNLTRAALGPKGTGIYLPALIIVAGSAIVQYFQSMQLIPNDKEAKGLRRILKDAKEGVQADQADVNAAVGRSTKFILPAMIFFLTAGLASALSLYWFVGGLVAYGQQALVLNKDEEEMEVIADKPSTNAKERAAKAVEAEVVNKISKKPKNPSNKKKKSKSKRRKK